MCSDHSLASSVLQFLTSLSARMADVVEKEVVIVGAGIAGVATALALRKVGVTSVLVLERAHELRSTGTAIGLAPNAWHALDALGVSHKLTIMYPALRKAYVKDIASGTSQEVSFPVDRNFIYNIDTDIVRIDEKMMHNVLAATHKLYFKTEDGLILANGRAENVLRVVHRRILLDVLVEELPTGTIRFSSKLASIKTETLNDGSSVSILNLEDETIIKAKVLIGCDGVHSKVAEWLGLDPAVDSGRSAVRGLAVYPEGHGLQHVVYQFLRDDKRCAFAPINDKEVYWFATSFSTHEEQEMARDPEVIQKHVLENMAKGLPEEYLDVVRHSDLSTLTWAPLVFRLPWSLIIKDLHKGCVTVAGDAMHPMTPDLGQGGCAALEDAVVLVRNIGENLHLDGSVDSKRVAKGIEKYVKERKWRAAKLIAGAYLSGWVQQGGSGWWSWMVQLFRKKIFYRFIQPKTAQLTNYDCGELPKVVLD